MDLAAPVPKRGGERYQHSRLRLAAGRLRSGLCLLFGEYAHVSAGIQPARGVTRRAARAATHCRRRVLRAARDRPRGKALCEPTSDAVGNLGLSRLGITERQRQARTAHHAADGPGANAFREPRWQRDRVLVRQWGTRQRLGGQDRRLEQASADVRNRSRGGHWHSDLVPSRRSDRVHPATIERARQSGSSIRMAAVCGN